MNIIHIYNIFLLLMKYIYNTTDICHDVGQRDRARPAALADPRRPLAGYVPCAVSHRLATLTTTSPSSTLRRRLGFQPVGRGGRRAVEPRESPAQPGQLDLHFGLPLVRRHLPPGYSSLTRTHNTTRTTRTGSLMCCVLMLCRPDLPTDAGAVIQPGAGPAADGARVALQVPDDHGRHLRLPDL